MKNLILNLLLELLISIVLFFFLSIVISLTSVNEHCIVPCIIAITTFSIFVGSFNYSKLKGEKGILYGGLLGMTYILILYLISSIINNSFGLSVNSIIMIFLSILIGIIGGILGVNLSNAS